MVSGGQVRLSQKDVTSLMCVCVGYQMLCLAERETFAKHGIESRYIPENVELGYFRRALTSGKLLESLAEQPCDDYESRHAFMVGFLMLLPEMIHDTAENIENEFMLTAVNSFHSGTSTLGLVCGFVQAIRRHNTAMINELTARSGLVITKEDYYRLYYKAMVWADEVIKAIKSEFASGRRKS
jgi:c-di-GMP-related signal transduction protein